MRSLVEMDSAVNWLKQYICNSVLRTFAFRNSHVWRYKEKKACRIAARREFHFYLNATTGSIMLLSIVYIASNK